MIPALILTAGLGTRLDPITRLVAKPAVPLGDRTLIEHVIGWLAKDGVPAAVLNLHHLPASVTRVVGDGRHLGLPVRYSWEQPVLGSAGGPRRALPLMAADRFLIVNGDTLCDFSIVPMLQAHVTSGADVTMAVIPNPAPAHYNGILSERDGTVTGFIPRGHTTPTWHFTGVQIVESRVFADLPDGQPAETVAGIYRELIRLQPGKLRVWQAPTSFIDVGAPRDYLDAALAHEASTPKNGTASRSVTNSYLWPGVTVASGVELDDCLVVGNVALAAGFRARSRIIAPASIVRTGDDMEIRDGVALFPLAPR